MTKLKQLYGQLGQWPPTTSTVIGLGLLFGTADYLLTGNVVQAVAAAGLFKVLCPEDAAAADQVTAFFRPAGKP